MAQPRRQPVRIDLSPRAEKLGLLAGLTAGLAYSTFASFVANALTPVSGRLIELDLLRRSVPGRYEEVLSLDGVIPTVLGALIVCAMVWLMTLVTLEHLQNQEVTQ